MDSGPGSSPQKPLSAGLSDSAVLSISVLYPVEPGCRELKARGGVEGGDDETMPCTRIRRGTNRSDMVSDWEGIVACRCAVRAGAADGANCCVLGSNAGTARVFGLAAFGIDITDGCTVEAAKVGDELALRRGRGAYMRGLTSAYSLPVEEAGSESTCMSECWSVL